MATYDFNVKDDNPVLEKGSEENTCVSIVCGGILYVISVLLIIVTFPFSLALCFKCVAEYERAAIFRLGRLVPEPKGPGIFCIIPCTDTFVSVDLRTKSMDVPPQEVLTKDSVTCRVDAVVYYKIFKPLTSVVKVKDALISTLLLSQTTLRNVLGTRGLKDILSEREAMQQQMLAILDEATDAWGIRVERIEIKDVSLPHVMQRAMAKEAEAHRDAQAKIIAAEGEKQAARSLREAAAVMSENKSALQLRYLQTLSGIATDGSSTIYFPLPLDSIGNDFK